MRLMLCILCLLSMAACSAVPSLQERFSNADALAAQQDWKAETVQTDIFDINIWLPRNIRGDGNLSVYIEGDGFAWVTSDMPSSNPTPVDPVGLKLALAQPAGNAFYLARPCQYSGAENPRCLRRYWTDARFAPEIVAAMNQAVDQIKKRFKATRLTLIGYSGGGAIAALLAERRSDVIRLVTVVGNLDPDAWAEFHNVSPLSGSLNPADDKKMLTEISQTHFAGGRDKNIPPKLIRAFASGMTKAQVVVMDDYDHKCCWAENWSKLWEAVR